MSRRRRAVLLLGLSVVLGTLAASDVARREAAVSARLAPVLPVVVTRADVRSGAVLRMADLGVRRVPARYAPVGVAGAPEEVAGRRLAAALPAGAYLVPGALEDVRSGGGAPVRRGERVAEVVALGSPELVRVGSQVDVLVTREGSDGAPGLTRLALEDVEVLAARPAEGESGDGSRAAGAPRVAASLRVSVRQAVYLAAAQSFARELRLLPRAAGDRRRGAAGLTAGEALR